MTDCKPRFAPVGLVGRLGEGSKLRDLFTATDPDTFWPYEPPSGSVLTTGALSAYASSGDDWTGFGMPNAPAECDADSRTPSDPDSPPPDGAEPISGDWDKKEPIINCRDAMLLAVGAGVVLAAAVFVTLLAAMGWVG